MGRQHANCHAVNMFLFASFRPRSPGRRPFAVRLLLPRGPGPPHPGLKQLPLLEASAAGKMRASDPLNSPIMNQLLISLPVEQQLLELKPNGSIIGNRGGPTWSARRESRVGAPQSRWRVEQRPGSRAGSFPMVTLRVGSIRFIEGVEQWQAES